MPARYRPAIAAAVAVLAGVAMSLGQTYAPAWLHPLFNSATPVVALSGATALAARAPWSSAALGALAGPLAVVGYYATASLRGFGASSANVAMWIAAGLAFGSVMGAAVWTMRTGSERAPVAVGLAVGWLPGIALGEAAHGLLRIADTTPAAYWWTQAAAALAVLAWLSLTRIRRGGARVTAAATTAAVAALLYVLYGAV